MRWLLCGVVFLFIIPATARAEDTLKLRLVEEITGSAARVLPEDDEENEARSWFWFVGAVNAYPRMESEKLIGRYFDPAMRALAPGFDDVRTVSDYRDWGLIWAPQIGIGKNFGKRWSFSVQGGYEQGKVRTKADDDSIFFRVPLHTDFEIFRSAAYVGGGIDFFPWGHPALGKYETWRERLRATRPLVGGSVTMTRAGYTARVRFGLDGIPNVGIKVSDTWTVFNLNLHVGAGMPLSRNTALAVNAGYNIFNRLDYDFGGFEISVAWQYFFR